MLALEASGKSAGQSRRPKERSPALGSAGQSLGFQRGPSGKRPGGRVPSSWLTDGYSPSERRMVPAANSCRRAPAQLSRIEAIAIGFRCATICGISGRLVGLTAEYPISRFCARRVSLAQASSAHTGKCR